MPATAALTDTKARTKAADPLPLHAHEAGGEAAVARLPMSLALAPADAVALLTEHADREGAVEERRAILWRIQRTYGNRYAGMVIAELRGREAEKTRKPPIEQLEPERTQRSRADVTSPNVAAAPSAAPIAWEPAPAAIAAAAPARATAAPTQVAPIAPPASPAATLALTARKDEAEAVPALLAEPVSRRGPSEPLIKLATEPAYAPEIPAPAPAAALTTLEATKPAAREVGAERPPPVPAAKQVTAPSEKPTAGVAGAKKAATGAEAKADKAEAAVAPSPRTAIAPAVNAIRHRAATARKHMMPPKVLVESAEEAGKKPHIEKKRADDCQTVEHVDVKAQEAETKGKGFKAAFAARLEAAISANMTKTPSTESEADELRERGAKNANAALQDESVGQSNAVIVPLKAAANPQEQPLGDSSAPPVQLEQVGPPPASVSAASVVPAPLPADRFDFSADHAPTDQVMADNNVTKQQLEEGNDPAFGPTLEARAEAEKHEAGIEARYRQAESRVQGNALGAAQHALAHGLSTIHDARKTKIGDVTDEQYGTRDKNEAERKTITEKITGIKNETLGDVNRILNLMETVAAFKFQFGLDRAEAAYDDAFKEARGGRARRAWSWLTKWGESWTEHIENLLKAARRAYDAEVKRTIEDVADFVEQQLTNARLRVASGLQAVQIFVKGLGDRALAIAKDAVTAVTADFNTMVNEIENRSEGLIDKLSQQYKASHERMLEMEEKLRQENKPLWERVYDATVGLIKKINELKDMLLDILGRAASAIWDIIKHPIRFLETLVSGVGDGLSNFIKKIDVYLQQGIFAWLLGESVQLPEKFDLAGVSSIVLQILHIDPAYFRARAVSLVGERVVTTLEQGAEEFEIVRREGIPGLRRLAHQHLSDLKSMVVDAIWGFIKNSVIGAGIEFILKLLTPASAFIAACKAIYEIVVFIIRRASQLKDLVSAVIDSITAIAKGDASAAAGRVEAALVKAIPVAIGFLASLLDLGDPAATVRSIIDKARSLVDRAIDAVINLAVKGVKAAGKLVAGVFGGKKEEKPAPKADGPSSAVPTDPAHQLALAQTVSAIDGLVAQQASPNDIATALSGLRTQFNWTSLELVPDHGGVYRVVGGFSPIFTVVRMGKSIDPRFIILRVGNVTSPAPSTTTPLSFEQSASFLVINDILPALFARTTVRRRKERVTLTIDQATRAVARARSGEALVFNEPRIPSVTGSSRSRTGVSYPDLLVLTKDFAISVEISLRSKWNVDEVVPGEAGARIRKGAQAPSLTLNLQPYLAANPALQLLLTIVSDTEPDERARQWIENFLADQASGRVIGFAWLVAPTK